MKIKLNEFLMFNPERKSIRSYILGIILSIIILYLFDNNIMWYISVILIQTLLLIWLETTYYPYGIKPEDME